MPARNKALVLGLEDTGEMPATIVTITCSQSQAVGPLFRPSPGTALPSQLLQVLKPGTETVAKQILVPQQVGTGPARIAVPMQLHTTGVYVYV